MEVILLERIGKLGQMGEIVRVRTAMGAITCSRRAKRCAPTENAPASKHEGRS